MAEAAVLPLETDILVMGAGPVGMTLALALKDTPWRVTLVDKRPLSAQTVDPRALALSEGARQLLQRRAAWPSQAATPIESIHISQKGGFGRTVMDRSDYDLPALGYVLRYRDVAAALQAALLASSRFECLEQVEGLLLSPAGPGRSGMMFEFNQGGQRFRLHAGLVVHAEGTPAEDPEVKVLDYGQHAVICEVQPDTPHGFRAWERFTPDGPLALLPLERGFAVVFTVAPARAAALLSMSDQAFLEALSRQFGGRFGFTGVGRRDAFPLALRQRRQLVQGPEVWIGNAAQTLHPVSGQGFNLGLRDACQLADLLCEAARSGGPPDDEAMLMAYTRQRQLDRQGGALFTDQVVRLFSNDLPPLRWGRGLGLLALDLLPPARAFVAKRMIWGARAWGG